MYEYEEDSDIIGLSCTLLNPYKGYMEGNNRGRLWQYHSCPP